MSKVDQVFGPIPGPLIQEWGQPAVFVRKTGSSYDPITGDITETEVRTSVKVVLTKLKVEELGGLYQSNDVKILLDPGQISNNYVTTSDYFEIPKSGGTEVLKVVDPTTYRGEDPVFFVIIARPQ